jgi:hypothetical protein
MIEQLKLYDVKSPKLRLGNDADGGYVVTQEILNKSTALFSYGVGSDISFELDYVKKTNKSSFFYDHTVNSPEIPEKYSHLMFFKKEGLSYKKEDMLNSFFSHYDESGVKGKVLLKMDIEENEFSFFLNTDIEKLSTLVSGIVVEFHLLGREENFNNFFKILEKLNKYFYHCHLHANNYAGSLIYHEYDIEFILPHVLELTFTNKDIVPYNGNFFEKIFKYDNKVPLDMGEFPTEHDRKNDWNRPDHSLSFINTINKLQ